MGTVNRKRARRKRQRDRRKAKAREALETWLEYRRQQAARERGRLRPYQKLSIDAFRPQVEEMKKAFTKAFGDMFEKLGATLVALDAATTKSEAVLRFNVRAAGPAERVLVDV